MKVFLSAALASLFVAALGAAGDALPEVDAFAAAPPVRRPLARAAEDVARPGTTVHLEERLGVPTFLQPARPGAFGRRALAQKGVEAEGAARAHLLDLAPLWGLTDEDVARAPLRLVHDTGHGALVVQFRQEAFGIPVFRDEIRVAMDRAFSPVAVAGHVPSVSGLAEPVFALGAADALARAAADFGAPAAGADGIDALGPAPGGYERLALKGASRATLAGPARARKVLFSLPGRLVPGWYLEVEGAAVSAAPGLYAYVVSAVDGALLYRHSLTAHDAYTYRVWADPSGLKMPLDGPQGRGGDPYPGPSPDGWQAPFVAPALVTLSSGPISTRDPWLPPGATLTQGNNVDAYADVATPDGFSAGDVRADVTAPGVFDRTFDVSKGPDASADQRKAAVTQLFYTTNFLHDWFYDAGFNEVSGNAQASNYGRGGLEGDALRAEAQDYSGTDNANMSTPSDGAPPRMQMYVWTLGAERSLAITAPAASAARLAVGTAAFGPSAFSSSGAVALADDGTAARTEACSPLVNGPSIAGRIALVDRGTCAFVVKIANAQAAGAVGVVVANNAGDATINMSEQAGATGLPYTIPSVFVGQSDGATLKSLLPSGLAVTLTRERNRDGTIDNQIVAHEWAHALSNRLVGDANGLDANQASGLGEGWSDFVALLLTVQPGDAALPANARFGGAYPVGAYATGGTSALGVPSQAGYFGIRRYPYSTDFARNPLTYRHIVNGAPLPADTPVNVGLYGVAVSAGLDNAEVHNTGEVWAAMLWECYAALLNDPRLTFEAARDRMRAYLVAALKLTPINPTLLEARDALLAVAFASDRDDHALFVRAFGKRGAGPRATGTADRFGTTNDGAVESFDVGGDLAIVAASLDDSSVPCDRDGRLDAGETGTLAVTLKNRGLFRLAATQVTLSSTNAAVSFPSGATGSVPTTDPTQSTILSVPVRLAPGTPGIQDLDLTLTLRDPALLSDETATFSFRGNVDDAPGVSAADDVESALSPWAAASAPGLDPAATFRRIEVTPFDHRWSSHAGTFLPSDLTLTSPPLVFPATGTVTLTFRHRYSFLAGPFVTSGTDYLDGGVLEFSPDGGASWTRGDVSISPAYNQTLWNGASAGNPLRGLKAWAGDSPNLPGFTPVTVTFGPSWSGKTVLVRFHRGMEGNFEENFWEVDDVAFHGILNTPFPALVPDRGRCRGRTIPVGASGGGTPVRKR